MPDPSRSDYDVVIIGAGPAGLAAAVELRRHQAKVVVIEREAAAGGIPRHCSHPPFGLREYRQIMTGPSYARRNVAMAVESGAEIRTGASAVCLQAGGRVLVSDALGISELAGRRVLLCLGAREAPRAARLIGGTRPIGVINTGALQVAVNLKRLRPFSRPLIVGTELVSLSSLLTCRHAGIRPAAIIEAAARPLARRPLAWFPQLLGIRQYLGAELVAIEGAARVEAATIRLADGGLRRIGCDGVLLTGNFTPESALPRSAGLAIDPGTGGPRVDGFGRCSDPAYFAAGNLLRPVETAGWCWQEGRRVGALIARDLVAGLPAGERVEITVQAPLRYAMPQVILAGQPAMQVQLRVSQWVKGRLTARQSGRIVAARRGAFVPERRILLDLPAGLADAPIEIRIDPG